MKLPNKVVSREQWLVARRALLDEEKTFSKQRDAIAAARRELPMVRLDKEYSFDGPSGKVALHDLFDGRAQLVVYHFMFDPAWDHGCKSCSLIADHFDGAMPHLRARDVSLVAVSRAPLAQIAAFQRRMEWRFPWLSSYESDFNYDFGVSFAPGRPNHGYNYATEPFPTSTPSGESKSGEAPGLSVFVRQDDAVLHAYSTYQRGVDILIGAYNILDLTPLGRHEEGLSYGMEWVRHHDRYDAD
jgi:predicted dithiol-disulfide oxidoreductase (DUF899 family)